jgi:primosomal protein N' (replication factor Y)
LPPSTKTILIEEESSRHYKDIKRPFLNAKTYLKIVAKNLQAKILYGDELLSIETYGNTIHGNMHEYTRLTHKINKPLKTLVTPQTKEPGGYSVVSKELEEMILFNAKQHSRMFLFVPRRGLALQTICLDCGKTVFCESCEAPLVLHEDKKGRIFICHHCGYKKVVEVLCATCGGWNLKGYGIASGTVKDAVETITGNTPLILDKEHTSTKKQEAALLKKFETEGGVLIGGERALSLLKEDSIAYGVFVSFDALLSLPDFRVEEKIMHLMTTLKKKTTTCLLLQTKNPKQDIIELGLGGEIGNFQKRELVLRKKFGYPPEKILIKITITEEKEKAKRLSSFIMSTLETYSPILFPAFIKSKKGKTIAHILLKIDPTTYPSDDLKNKLLSLPPSVAVNVSPQSLL